MPRILLGLGALLALLPGYALVEIEPPPEYFVVIGPDLYYANFTYQNSSEETPRYFTVEIKRAIFADSAPEPYNAALLELENPPTFGCERLATCLLKIRRDQSEIELWRHLSRSTHELTDDWFRFKLETDDDFFEVEGNIASTDLDPATKGSADEVSYSSTFSSVTVDEDDLIEFDEFGGRGTTRLEDQLSLLEDQFVHAAAFELIVKGTARFLMEVPDAPIVVDGSDCDLSCALCDAHAINAGVSYVNIQQCEGIICQAIHGGAGAYSGYQAWNNCRECRICRGDGSNDPPNTGECAPEWIPCPDEISCCPVLHCPEGSAPCNGFNDCCPTECDPDDWNPLLGC
ncbi:hypothetical protein ABI59_16770 [Acidobacteria bacterium Mor1]|nr:hypothetical protein ABI59_16770 [Acidobacteria bacterium Mor1]